MKCFRLSESPRVLHSYEGAQLGGLFGLPLAEHLLPPAVPEQVYARWRTEEPLLVAVQLLGDFGVKDHDHHVRPVPQVAPHGLPGQPAVIPEKREYMAPCVGYARQSVLMGHLSRLSRKSNRSHRSPKKILVLVGLLQNNFVFLYRDRLKLSGHRLLFVPRDFVHLFAGTRHVHRYRRMLDPFPLLTFSLSSPARFRKTR
jgi:hypothetical protein